MRKNFTSDKIEIHLAFMKSENTIFTKGMLEITNILRAGPDWLGDSHWENIIVDKYDNYWRRARKL